MRCFSSLVWAPLLILAVDVCSGSVPGDVRPSPEPAGDRLLNGRYRRAKPRCDVTLYLYTRKNPSTPEVIKAGNRSTSPSFDARNPTRFVVHGWRSDLEELRIIVPSYLATGRDYNVVLVDWSGPARDEYLSAAIDSTRLVGQHLAAVIGSLEAERGLNLNDVFLIGFSLGAQVVGVAGNRLGGRVARIVGLDAAGPLFDLVPLENRLDKSDGRFVEAIHTNAGFKGMSQTYGHVDFFPNGGSYQAGCGFDLFGDCSHARAPAYYIESITNNRFEGILCHSYSNYLQGRCRNNTRDVMGEYTSGRITGRYYLTTNPRSPFYRGVA